MKSPERVVFDWNVLFQAIISPAGPAGQLLAAVNAGKISLFVSEFVLDELKDVTARPKLASQFKFNRDRVARFFDSLTKVATTVSDVPHIFDFPRDQKDAHYVDLALAADAKLIVSRDKDLLSLRDTATAEGRDFLSRFPTLSILTPPEALKLIRTTPSPD